MKTVPVASLTDNDWLFLDQTTQVFAFNELPYAVLDGDINAIKSGINRFSATADVDPKQHDWMTHYAGPLLPIVQVACKAYADRMTAQPMSALDHLYAHWRMNKQVRYQDLYQKYLAR